jgi:hypothetical protein
MVGMFKLCTLQRKEYPDDFWKVTSKSLEYPAQ